jgi:hypothetical protein
MGGHIATQAPEGKEKPGCQDWHDAADIAVSPYPASTVTTPGTALMAPAICGETL